MKSKRLDKAQVAMKNRIEKAYRKKCGFRYQNPLWDKKLWSRTNHEIQEFFMKMFETTLDEVEYYSAIVFLWHTLPNQELLVEFHKSPQWLDAAKTYDHTTERETLYRSEQTTTECGTQPVETVKSVETIRVIGDE